MKKIFSSVLAASMIITIHFLCACSDDSATEENFPPPSKIEEEVSVKLSVEAEKMLLSRSINADLISDINIYFFRDSKKYHFYFSEFTSTFELQILPGTYQIYVVTNIHKDLGEMTKEELQNYDYIAEEMVTDIPMTAQKEVNILSSVTLPAIQVKRAAAKITYSITVADAVSGSIKLRSIQFMNVPKTTVLFASGNVSADKNDYFDDTIIETNNTKSYSSDYYMLENCQGEVSSITDPTDKAPANAPACATYMRILADGPDKTLEYIVYLGENSTTNFDVRRNTKHDLNLYIKGENEIDNRVSVFDGLYYGTANCQICTGTEISFDVTPYRTSYKKNFIYTNVYAGKEYEAKTAKLIWQGTNHLITSATIFENKLKIRTSGAKGNAVVAVCDATGTVRWSYHIWCTGGEVPRNIECENYAKARFYAMDRNLGALSISPANFKDAGGLLYQWGRKDPFPGLNEDNIYTPSQSGTFITVFPAIDKSKIATFDDLLSHFASNPATYISMDAEGYDDQRTLGLWGDPDGANSIYNKDVYAWSSKKSIYDPCPEGYRVANQYTWTGISIAGLSNVKTKNELTSSVINIVGPWNYGWTFSGVSEGIYYPASSNRTAGGILDIEDYSKINTQSWLWSSTIVTTSYNDPLAGVMGHARNQIQMLHASWGYGPEFGFSVRCVQE